MGDGISTLVARLVTDARALAGAEVALVKAKVGERVSAYKSAIVFFAVAGVLALAGLVALLVGLILTVATLVGPGLATLIVVMVTFSTGGVLALVGKSRLAAPKIEDVA